MFSFENYVCYICDLWKPETDTLQITAILLCLKTHLKSQKDILFQCFFLTSHFSKRTMTWKHWLGKYCIIIITISLRKVACSLNIQHHNYNFHKECRTVIINNTKITWSIRENRLLGQWREKDMKPVFWSVFGRKVYCNVVRK